MSDTYPPLLPGHYYHVYNRGINGEKIFLRSENYRYFLRKYGEYILPVADTFCYCLLKNHFHFLIRIKEHLDRDLLEKLRVSNPEPSLLFSHFFNCYSQSFNKENSRTGSLFQRPFKRKEVDSDIYFCQLIYYIHLNPVRHKMEHDYTNYPYSSFRSILAQQPTRLMRKEVLDWFGGETVFVEYHKKELSLIKTRHLFIEDD